MRERGRVNIFGAALLVVVGVILLLNTLGILEWSVWWSLVRLWPVFLIAAGLDLLLGRRSIWGGLLATAFLVAVVVGALWLMQSDAAKSGLTTQEIQQPLGGATQAEVAIEPAMALLRLEALPETANLVEGAVRLEKGEELVQDLSQQGSKVTYKLTSEGESWEFFTTGWNELRVWELGLSPGAALQLKASLALGDSVLDLTGLSLSDLRANMGLGRTKVTLPAEGRFQARIEHAIGGIEVIVPEGMAVRVHADTGLVTRKVPDDFRKHGDDVYTSPGYDSADDRVDLEVDLAIGVLTIRHSE